MKTNLTLADREYFGEVVRLAWLDYCEETGRDDTPGRTLPWEELDEWSKEVDRRIGEAVIAAHERVCAVKQVPAESTALASVLAEREHQDVKWGEQNNDPFCYLTVLMEEVGELAQAALHTRFGGPAAVKLREEAVHTAAVALAIVECLDRGLWRWSGDEPAS